jgi:hypothetical protein
MIVKRYHAVAYVPRSDEFLSFGIFDTPEEAEHRASTTSKSFIDSTTNHDPIKYGVLEIASISTPVNHLSGTRAKDGGELPSRELHNKVQEIGEKRLRAESWEQSK